MTAKCMSSGGEPLELSEVTLNLPSLYYSGIQVSLLAKVNHKHGILFIPNLLVYYILSWRHKVLHQV